MITSVFLSSIYVIFPLIVYFIYMFYSKTIYEKEKLIFFDLSLLSSFYLSIKFGQLKLISIFLINIPLLLALYKKRTLCSIILIFITSIYLADFFNINIYLYLICYLFILILSYLKKNKVLVLFILSKVILDIIMIIAYYKQIFNINYIYFFLFKETIMCACLYAVLLSYNKINNVVNLYKSLEEITKEKTMYESLFKITHEIKNPLAVCKGYLDMFDINDTIKANKYLNIITQEIDRTLVLLKDFSDVSKISIKKNIMDVTMLLDDVYDETKLLFKSDIKLEYISLKKEVYIEGDYGRLKQVLINVIKNAKESLENNGVVYLECKITNKNCTITVKDNGIGMNKDTLKKIGTPFYTTKKQGTGLGVCFSREIIEKHDGLMNYSSKIGKGTTVKIILPLINQK